MSFGSTGEFGVAGGTGGGSGGTSDASTVLKFVCTDRLTPISASADIYSEHFSRSFFITEIIAELIVPHSTGTFTIDILKNGVSILTEPLTIDAGEETSVTAATPVIFTSEIAKSDEVAFAVTDDADGAASGLIIYFNGHYVAEPDADEEAPTVPADLALTVLDDESIQIDFTDSTDNVAVTSYEIKVNGGAFTDQITNIGLANPYTLTGLAQSTDYDIEIRAKDGAGNVSAWSSPETATTEATPFSPFWDSVHIYHTETLSNGLEITTVGESGFSVKNDVGLATNGDYIEFEATTDGDWEAKVGRVIVGTSASFPGIWYETASNIQLSAVEPVEGDVFRVEKIAGNNVKIYRNGVLEETTAYGDQGSWSIQFKSYGTVSLNQVFDKPTISKA